MAKKKKSLKKAKKSVSLFQPQSWIAWAFVVLLVVCVIALSTYVVNRDNAVRFTAKFLHLSVAEDVVRIPGRACGVLNTEKAEQYLGEPAERKATNVAGPVLVDDKQSIWRIDGCEYTSQTNDTLFVELFINTYDSVERAQQQFTKVQPVVNKSKILNAEVYSADELVYDSGVIYMRKGKQIVVVGGSNGVPSQSEQFALSLVADLIPQID